MRAAAKRSATLGVAIPHFEISTFISTSDEEAHQEILEKTELEGAPGSSAFLRSFGVPDSLAGKVFDGLLASGNACGVTSTYKHNRSDEGRRIEAEWADMNLLPAMIQHQPFPVASTSSAIGESSTSALWSPFTEDHFSASPLRNHLHSLLHVHARAWTQTNLTQ